MTDIEQKALELVNAVRGERGYSDQQTYPADRKFPPFEALCRAIEQHEAFRQEVSDAVGAVKSLWDARDWPSNDKFEALSRFIIVKTDPLVEAINSAPYLASAKETADHIRAAIEARGGRIVWEGE